MKILSYCEGFHIRALLFIKWKLVRYNMCTRFLVFKFNRLTEIEHVVKETSKKNVSVVIDVHTRCEKVN
jgi:hypothetical protein